ncbi:MAG: alpha/beta hydrolase [Bacilli bacterium]
MKINEVDINYIDYGKSDKQAIVLLHGWGQNIEMMKGLGDKFIKSNRIIILDLPGFGCSEEPTYAWTVLDYVYCIHELLTNLKIKNPILIGHSFGGKISLLYASMYEVNKLVCLASPFKCEKTNGLKTKILKNLKQVPLLNKLEGFAKKHIGSSDYKAASEIMRSILVKTVNFDITNEVKKINCPTLLIWGTNDMAVSIDDAHELEHLIKDAGLVIYDNCTHYAYLERFNQTVSVLKSFIGEELK